MQSPKFLLITPYDGLFFGQTVKECIDDAAALLEVDVKLKLRLKQYTLHKVGVAASWAFIHKETTPKARCINPPEAVVLPSTKSDWNNW